MKQLYKAALLAALGLASVSAVQAQSYTPGDLIVGFTTGGGNDLLYDLGQASALYNGETFSGLSSLLSSDTLSSLSWGVLGMSANSGSPRTAYTTTAVGITPTTINGASKFSTLDNNFLAIVENDFSSTPSAGSSATVSASATTSWYTETDNSSPGNTYINNYENPNVTGVGSDSFSQVLNNNTAPTLLGGFTLGADDSFTYNTVSAVPEPTTYGMLAGAGLLMLSFRNQLHRKQA